MDWVDRPHATRSGIARYVHVIVDCRSPLSTSCYTISRNTNKKKFNGSNKVTPPGNCRECNFPATAQLSYNHLFDCRRAHPHRPRYSARIITLNAGECPNYRKRVEGWRVPFSDVRRKCQCSLINHPMIRASCPSFRDTTHVYHIKEDERDVRGP